MRNRVKVQKGRVLKGSINLPTNFTMTLLRVARFFKVQRVHLKNLWVIAFQCCVSQNTSGWFIKISVCYVACFYWYKFFFKKKFLFILMSGQETAQKDFRLSNVRDLMTQHWLSFLMRTKSFVTCVLLFVVTKLSIVYSFPPYVAPAFDFVILFSLFFLFLLPFVLLHLHRANTLLYSSQTFTTFVLVLLLSLCFVPPSLTSR